MNRGTRLARHPIPGWDKGAAPKGLTPSPSLPHLPPREVPVHPTLACILAEWKLSGWQQTYGRKPARRDLIVPTRRMNMRNAKDAQVALLRDLETLELRRRRGHDLRRSFITLALVDGARRDLLEVVTHGPRGDIVSMYSSFPWPALCAEVAKLKISIRDGELVKMREQQAACAGELQANRLQSRLQSQERPRIHQRIQGRLKRPQRDAMQSEPGIHCSFVVLPNGRSASLAPD